MSEYTVPIDWAEVKEGMTVELRHDNYLEVLGDVAATGGASVRVNGAWHFGHNGWSVWVKPEPAEPDLLVAVLDQNNLYVKNDGGGYSFDPTDGAAAVRAAGYMTEAEWEAKHQCAGLPQFGPEVPNSWAVIKIVGFYAGWEAARKHLAATLEDAAADR